jgi:membrane-associated phospholipid phosphatase
MMPPGQRLWHWPTRDHLRRAMQVSAAVSLWFVLVYGGADWLTHQHGYRVRLHIDPELRVPFVPAAVLAYMSLYPLFIMAPFVLRTDRELTALAMGLTVEIGVAGIGFLLFPADNRFSTPVEMGVWKPVVRFAKWLALDHNLAPSLHVRQAPPLGRAVLAMWAGAIGLSTLLLHQHYVIDVVTGYLLAFVVLRCVHDPFLRTRPANRSTRQGPSA